MLHTCYTQQIEVDCSNYKVQDLVSVTLRLEVCYSRVVLKLTGLCRQFPGKTFSLLKPTGYVMPTLC